MYQPGTFKLSYKKSCTPPPVLHSSRLCTIRFIFQGAWRFVLEPPFLSCSCFFTCTSPPPAEGWDYMAYTADHHAGGCWMISVLDTSSPIHWLACKLRSLWEYVLLNINMIYFVIFMAYLFLFMLSPFITTLCKMRGVKSLKLILMHIIAHCVPGKQNTCDVL